MKAAQTKLSDDLAKASTVTGAMENAKYFRDVIKVDMDELRAPADKLETLVDEEYWPFPQYEELIFEV